MLDPQSDRDRPASTVSPSNSPRSTRRGATVRPAVARDGTEADTMDLGRVRAVIDALPEAVLVTDPDGGVRLTNPAADRMFAERPVRTRDDLLSRFVAVDDGHGPPTVTTAGAGTAAEADPRDGDARDVMVRPHDDPSRWFALRTVALDTWAEGPAPGLIPDAGPPAGEPAAADEPAAAPPADGAGRSVFVLRDVTDTRDLRPIREAFLAVLSHELRTPITTIYAGSSVLARRPTLSPPATRVLAMDISAEAARLYDLVEDLLVLARLERHVLEPIDEPVLLQRSVEATMRTIADRMPDPPVDVHGDPDLPPVHGDGTYVEQACRDLILAGVRYAEDRPDRRLRVEIRRGPTGDDVELAVLDRGPSLDDDELDRAFDLPDPASVGRLAWTGIGPFVCRHLVASMGGRAWARNRPDGGLELGFALPVDGRG